MTLNRELRVQVELPLKWALPRSRGYDSSKKLKLRFSWRYYTKGSRVVDSVEKHSILHFLDTPKC